MVALYAYAYDGPVCTSYKRCYTSAYVYADVATETQKMFGSALIKMVCAPKVMVRPW